MNYDEIINNQHLGREEKITALKLIIEKSQKCLDIMEYSKPPKQLPSRPRKRRWMRAESTNTSSGEA